MIHEIVKVKGFHRAYGCPWSKDPVMISDKRKALRLDMAREELNEREAATDIISVADALADEHYIWCGSVLEYGLMEAMRYIFDEVHRSNMSKLGEDGKPIFREDGKVLKGPNFRAPDIAAIMKKVYSGRT